MKNQSKEKIKKHFDEFLQRKGLKADYYARLQKDDSFFDATIPEHWITVAFHWMGEVNTWQQLDKDWRVALFKFK